MKGEKNKKYLDCSLSTKERMISLIRCKQQEIVSAIEKLDNVVFKTDKWEREENGGGGESMVFQNGKTFEKAGVNISFVNGNLSPNAIKSMKNDHVFFENVKENSFTFFACGLSLVIHPHNPHAPTVHLNYRYFEIYDSNTNELVTSWFGGGSDLTPSYLYEEDAILFHDKNKQALDKFDISLYPRFKLWCDKYFYIKHRQEARGIGGIFFDDFNEKSPNEMILIIESCFDAFLSAYVTIITRRKDTPFDDHQKQWQQIRRGRYVEFNLIYDRGTQFGLSVPGSRVESILVSLPLTASWFYDHVPEKNSEEEKLLKILKTPIDWV